MTIIDGVPIIKFRSPKIPEITVCRIRNTRVVLLPENENPAGCRRRQFQVPVLKLYYYQRTKIQPAAGDGGSNYYKQEEEEKEKREEEEEVIIDTPSFLTVARISRSNLSFGGGGLLL